MYVCVRVRACARVRVHQVRTHFYSLQIARVRVHQIRPLLKPCSLQIECVLSNRMCSFQIEYVLSK